MLANTDAERKDGRPFELGLVWTTVAIAGALFAYVWGNDLLLSVDPAAAWKDIHELGNDCEYSTGLWQDGSFATAVAESHHYTKVLVPFRRANVAPPVNDDGYLILRCHADLGTPSDHLYGWLSVGRIFGPSAVYLDGRLKAVQDVTGIMGFPLLPAERSGNATVTIVSRKDLVRGAIGPATLMPPFYTDDPDELARVDHVEWFSRVERPAFLAGYALAILVFFAVAWVIGLRYPDVGWMTVVAACAAAQNAVGYTPLGDWPPWRDVVGVSARYSVLFGLAGFLFSFLRVRPRTLRPAPVFVAALALIVAIRLGLPKEYRDLLGYKTWLPSAVATVIFVVAAVAGALQVRLVTGVRRGRLIALTAVSGAAAALFPAQALLTSSRAFVVEPFLVFGIMTLFAAFLAADLVTYHRGFFSEKDKRQAEAEERQQLEGRLELGRAVQALLLPKEMEGGGAGYRFSFFYEPSQGMAGDWIATWQHGGIRHLVLGDVVGKGPQAAIAVTAIMAALTEARSQGLDLRASILRVNRGLHDLFAGHIVTTLTAAAVTPDRSVRLYTCGSVGWYLHAGGACRRIGTGGSLLGIDGLPQIGEQSCELRPGDLLFTFTDGVIDGARSTAKLLNLLKGQVYGVGDHRRLFDLAVEAGKDHVHADDKGMVVVSALVS